MLATARERKKPMIPMKTSDGNPHYGSLHMRFCEVEFQRQQSRGARSLLHIRKWCVCVVVVLFASISAFGLTAMVDGIKWTYTVSNGKASVGGGTSSRQQCQLPLLVQLPCHQNWADIP